MGYIVTFNHLEVISNVALLLSLIVPPVHHLHNANACHKLVCDRPRIELGRESNSGYEWQYFDEKMYYTFYSNKLEQL